jgi:hypothetical protein
MFGQKFTNINEILQCMTLHCADFVAAKLAQLNTALAERYSLPGVRHGRSSFAGWQDQQIACRTAVDLVQSQRQEGRDEMRRVKAGEAAGSRKDRRKVVVCV